jgi:hypothetical protein
MHREFDGHGIDSYLTVEMMSGTGWHRELNRRWEQQLGSRGILTGGNAAL